MNPANFTTFRHFLRPNVNTSIIFRPEADVRYAIYPDQPFSWRTPAEEQHISVLRNTSRKTCLTVAPGRNLLKDMVDRRRKIRGGDMKDEEMEVPHQVMVEWCQGFMGAPQGGEVQRKESCGLWSGN